MQKLQECIITFKIFNKTLSHARWLIPSRSVGNSLIQVERENKGRGKFLNFFFFGINIVFLHQRSLKICEYHFIDIIFIDYIFQ